LKPPNILLDDYDHCVLADFGISKFVEGSNPHMPSHVQGTFNYMSPEAFDPEQFGGITVRTDSWSFACTLLEMLTGDQPWKDMKMAPICFKVMQKEIPIIPCGLPTVLEKMLRSCFSFEPQNRPSFKEMYSVFRSNWAFKETEEQQTASRRPADPLGLGLILDAFRGNNQDERDGIDPTPPPRASMGGNKFKVTAIPVMQGGSGGRSASCAADVDGDSSIAGLYKRAAEADEAKKTAECAKRELKEIKMQMATFREESESSDNLIKDALAGKEEVVGQLQKVMKVCEELQQERKSLAQQLLDLQDQLMSQENKMSEDRAQRQNAEAAKIRAEKQLAIVSAERQESVSALQQSADMDHMSKIVQKLQRENTESNSTIKNLVDKLGTVTQELIAVTEERDTLYDQHEKLRMEALELGKASCSMEEEYNNLRATLEEMRDVHQYELDQANQQHDSATSSAHRIISQEKEAADRRMCQLEASLESKYRNVENAKGASDRALVTSRKDLDIAREDKELLDRRLAQSALENVKLQEHYDRMLADKDRVEARAADLAEKNRVMTSVLDTAEPRRLKERADRLEKEREQWHLDRNSLQESLKEMEDMGRRLSDADKRAHTLASEKRQLESARLTAVAESEVDRTRSENALASQKLEYEKRILDLEQAYERLKQNRDSISTSDETLVTERSMDGGSSLDIKNDAFSVISLDFKSDAYEKYLGKGGEKTSSQSSPHSESSSLEVRAEERSRHDKDGLRSSMDQDRVARVLHQLAIECDKQSTPTTPTYTKNTQAAATRVATPVHILQQAAATRALLSNSLRPSVHASSAVQSQEREANTQMQAHTASQRSATRVDRPSSPPPAMTLRDTARAWKHSNGAHEDLFRPSSGGGSASPAQLGVARVLTTRKRLDESLTPGGESTDPRNLTPLAQYCPPERL